MFKLALDNEDRALIESMLANMKQPRGDCYQWERGLGSF